MPYVTIQMLEGRSPEVKRELVKAITQEVSRICDVGPERVHIILEDLPRANLAIGGTLISDRK